jgi:hypothetical protein
MVAAIFVATLVLSWLGQVTHGRRYADAVVLHQVARVVRWLDGDIEEYRSIARRREMAECLEVSARYMERGLSLIMRLPSVAITAAIRQRLHLTAQQVREYQIWVMLPNPSTRADLIRNCCRIFGAVALGEYDLLPAAPALQLDRPSRLHIALSGTGMVLIGLLPLAVVLALRWRGVTLPSPLDTAAVAVATLWAFVSVLIVVDPLFNARLAAVKGLTQVAGGLHTASPKSS